MEKAIKVVKYIVIGWLTFDIVVIPLLAAFPKQIFLFAVIAAIVYICNHNKSKRR